MKKIILFLGIGTLLFSGCNDSENASLGVGEYATIGSLIPEESTFRSFGNIQTGHLYIAEGYEEEVLEGYLAQAEDSLWRININGTSGTYQILPMNELDLTALAPGEAFGEIDGAICLAIMETGKCVNISNIETGDFMGSLYTLKGGISYCVARVANTCKFMMKKTGTIRTYKDPNCPGNGASAGEMSIRICEFGME